ncbi:hypothetical protein [Methanobrevibacter sp.]
MIGGLIVIVLFVGSYMSNITQKTQNSLHQLLKTEREYILDKI